MDELRAEDVDTGDVARLLAYLRRCEVGGLTYVPTWNVRRVLAGQEPAPTYPTPELPP